MALRYLWLVLIAMVSVGCSSNPAPLAMATTAEKARPAMENVLAAWKAGKTAADLKAQSPQAYFNDADFSRGAKLVDFKIESDGTPSGTGYRFDVTITTEQPGKTAKPKKLAYRVVTEPVTSISREDD